MSEKPYKVQVKVTAIAYVTAWAENEDQAMSRAIKQLEDGFDYDDIKTYENDAEKAILHRGILPRDTKVKSSRIMLEHDANGIEHRSAEVVVQVEGRCYMLFIQSVLEKPQDEHDTGTAFVARVRRSTKKSDFAEMRKGKGFDDFYIEKGPFWTEDENFIADVLISARREAIFDEADGLDQEG